MGANCEKTLFTILRQKTNWRSGDGILWGTLNFLLVKLGILLLPTLPIIGNSTDPHVSAPQCTNPELKSAVIIPHKAATVIEYKFSNRTCIKIKKKFTAINVMQIPTHIHSCVRLPENKKKINHQKFISNQ